MTPIEQAKNLGPKSAGWLRQIGIESVEELRELGAVTCYKMLLAAGIKANKNLLYAIYGAVNHLHWAKLPDAVKNDLIAALNDPNSPFC